MKVKNERTKEVFLTGVLGLFPRIFKDKERMSDKSFIPFVICKTLYYTVLVPTIQGEFRKGVAHIHCEEITHAHPVCQQIRFRYDFRFRISGVGRG